MDLLTFESLPVAAVLTRAGRIVAANPAYEAMMGIAASSMIGRGVQELVVEQIEPPDAELVSLAATSRSEGRGLEGSLWCRLIDGRGHRRAVKVLWRPSPSDPELNMVFLLDDGGASDAKAAAEKFARAGSDLFREHEEQQVLERAADALAAQGFTVTFLLIQGDDPFLAYGPTRSPITPSKRTFEAMRLPRGILAQINPRFHEGRALFLQNAQDTVNRTYDAEIARSIEAARPGRFSMQAPLFVSDEPYGALVLTGDALTPALAGAAEVFAALVARAIENVRMQDVLVQNERLAAIGEAAAVMAHEVRNPVGALLNAVTLLRRGEDERPAAEGSSSRNELLAMITDEAQNLEHIVSDLLALGRPITPRLVIEDLRTPVSRALAVARMREPTANVVLHAADPLMASIDPDLVQIAVLNLLRNALQASPEGTPIEVFVELVRGEPSVRIDDRGPGIPSALSRRVFEPFYTTRPAGTGIGLAAVRRIVEACGGRVEVGATDSGGGRVSMHFRA